MGSTVIVLLPADGPSLDPGLTPEQAVKVGQRIGSGLSLSINSRYRVKKV